MRDEMSPMLSNQTCQLTKLLKGKKALQNKCVHQIKEEHDGNKWYKVKLVTKGQKEGIDYIESFSPMVKLTIVRTMLGLVAKEDINLEQLAEKIAFFHSDF